MPKLLSFYFYDYFPLNIFFVFAALHGDDDGIIFVFTIRTLYDEGRVESSNVFRRNSMRMNADGAVLP